MYWAYCSKSFRGLPGGVGRARSGALLFNGDVSTRNYVPHRHQRTAGVLVTGDWYATSIALSARPHD